MAKSDPRLNSASEYWRVLLKPIIYAQTDILPMCDIERTVCAAVGKFNAQVRIKVPKSERERKEKHFVCVRICLIKGASTSVRLLSKFLTSLLFLAVSEPLHRELVLKLCVLQVQLLFSDRN